MFTSGGALTAIDCDEAVMPSLSADHEGRGTAMLVGRLDAWITRRDTSVASSAAEYLLRGSPLHTEQIIIYCTASKRSTTAAAAHIQTYMYNNY